MTDAPARPPVASRRTLRRGFAVIGRGFRAQPGTLAVAVIASAVYGVVTVLMARVIGHLTGSIIEPAARERAISSDQILTIVWQLGLVVVVTVVAVILRRVGAGMAFFNLQAITRRQVSAQYLRLPLSWHHRHPSGQLLSNANADVEAAWGVFQPLPMAIGVLVMLVVAGVEMVGIDLVLALIGFCVFPALFAVNLFFQSRMSPRATRVQQLRAQVSEVAHESVEAGLLVKAMGREEAEAQRFAASADELRDAAIRMGRTRAAFDPVIDAIPTLGTLAVLLVGTHRVASGAVSPAEIVQLAYLFSLLAFPVRSIGWVLADLPRTVVGWDRVQAVLAADEQTRYGDSEPVRPAHGQAQFQDISYRYPSGGRADLSTTTAQQPAAVQPETTDTSRPALDAVSLDVTAGSTTAIVGPTGSGKTTLAGLAMRLMDPDTGQVLLDGIDLRQLRRGGLPSVATLAGQDPFLFDDTVAQNVLLGSDAGRERLEQALDVAQARTFIDALPEGVQTRVGERGTSLSGGQRQRIALARAVIRDPALLVLDDATSAVDTSVEAAILDALRTRSAGMTVLVVAYRLSTIALADQVVYLDAGRVVDTGTHEELLTRCPGYRDLVGAYARDAQEREAAGQEQAR
ncbi:ABC transporter ATP-binding protein [Dermacoccaceae bacterium W4C1]